MPSLYYDPRTGQLHSSLIKRNWVVCVATLNMFVAYELFVNVQIRWTNISLNYLSSTADSLRGFATTYAFQSLVFVAVMCRHRYAAYFNFLQRIDRGLRNQLNVGPDIGAARRSFWRYAGWLLSNYLIVSLPFSIALYGKDTVVEFAYMLEYGLMAIWMGLISGFLRYAAHCCLVRFACVRGRLEMAVGLGGNRRDVHLVILLLEEMDVAKQMLNDGFNALLTCKLAIDGLNMIISVYLITFNIINHGGVFAIKFLESMFYEIPYFITDVLMVQIYHRLGNEVSISEFRKIQILLVLRISRVSSV